MIASPIIPLMNKARAEMEQVRVLLDNTLNEIKDWEVRLDLIWTPDELLEHKNALIMAYARVRILQSEYDTLFDFTMRLLAQQQSAKDAFSAGWDARLTDILARLNSDECAQLRQVLLDIALDEQPF